MELYSVDVEQNHKNPGELVKMIARIPASVEKTLNEIMTEDMCLKKKTKGSISYAFLRMDEYARLGREQTKRRLKNEERLF